MDQPTNQGKPPSGVSLAEAALSGWCRLLKISQYFELDFHEFQIAVSIFQYEVENSANNQELVPSTPYDSLVLVLNHAPLPQSEENGPKEESS